MYFYKPDYSNEINSPFARDNENKLIRRSYWLDLPDQSLILLFTNGIRKNITNEEKLREYAIKARAAVEKYKGRFLIRGGRSTSNEGEKSPRTVVIEFPSYDEANLFYKSKEYQEAHEILQAHAIRHQQTIEGA